jgi:hypothetical protein
MNHILMAEEKIKRDDRVRYYTIRLKDAVSKNKIFKLIEKNGITSKSTAERVSKGVFDWNEGEIELFLATYCPTKSDNEVIDEVLGLNASKVSSEVAEEPVSNDKLKDGEIINHNGKKYKHIYTGEQTFEDCQKCSLFDDDIECYGSCSDRDTEIRGYFVEVAEEDMCTECDIEAAHIISELSDKNQELQKELHTSKNVITTLQKGVDELNETVTESKIAIAEVAKERDDKAEEARVLNLDLLRKENNMDKLVEDFRELETKYENLLEVLETKNIDIELNPKYDSLYKVLLAAYNQAANGKGKERHQLNNEEPFEDQKICEIARRLSIDYNLGQAVKKIYESKRLTDGRDIAELYGAINYIAAAIIVKQEKIK